jgi:C-terminal processing protease CtpA/Prc
MLPINDYTSFREMEDIMCKSLTRRLLDRNAMLACIAIAVVLLFHASASATITLQGKIEQQIDVPQHRELGIVGLNFDIRGNYYPRIVKVYSGTPAEQAGLRPGDAIIGVNSERTLGLSPSQLDLAISDVPGDVIHFMVQRRNRVFDVTLQVQSLSEISSQASRTLYTGLFIGE